MGQPERSVVTEHIMDTGHSINKVQQYSQTGQSKGYMVSMVKEAVEIQDSPEGQTSVYLY